MIKALFRLLHVFQPASPNPRTLTLIEQRRAAVRSNHRWQRLGEKPASWQGFKKVQGFGLGPEAKPMRT